MRAVHQLKLASSVYLVAIALLCGPLTSQNFASDDEILSEAENRLDEFFQNMQEHASEYSVAMRLVEVVHPSDPAEDLSAASAVFRRVVGKWEGKAAFRFDLLETADSNSGSLPIYSHVLVTADKTRYSWGIKRGSRIQIFENDDKKVRGKIDQKGKINPLTAPSLITLAAGMTSNDMAEQTWRESKIFAAKRDREKLRVFGAHMRGTAVFEVVFAKEPQWLVLETRGYKNPGKPVNYLEVDMETTKKWKLKMETRTSWIRIGDEFLPARTIFRQRQFNQDGDSLEAELAFGDWRLGNDVQATLLSSDRFTPELITQDSDFTEMENLVLETLESIRRRPSLE